MKKTILLSIFIIGLGQLNAQITLTKPDYTAQVGSFIFRMSVDPNSVSTPTEGPNQVWDYTSLETLDEDTITLNSYSGATYPDANISQDGTNFFNTGILSYANDKTTYEVLNDTEYGIVGLTHFPINIPVGALTGTATDTLYFLEHDVELLTPSYHVWFPMNFEDERSSNYIDEDTYLATIGAFGLDHVPSSVKSHSTILYEIVGWGNLMLTNPTDQSTVSLETLLMKESTFQQDSFFTGGAPTPAQLLGAMQVTQNQLREIVSYRFYAKGFPAPVLTIDDGSVWMLSDLGAVTSSTKVSAAAIPFECSPNPATDQVHLQFEKSTNEPWLFSLYNSSGQKVFEHVVAQPSGTVNEPVEFRKQFPAGSYYYVLHNGDHKIMSSGGLQMQ